MPQILVLTNSPQREDEVVYRERVPSSSLESEHFAGQLLERVGWAVKDADNLEHRSAPESLPPREGLARPAYAIWRAPDQAGQGRREAE